MNDDNKTILKGMDINQLESWCQSNDFSKFRAKQIYDPFFGWRYESFSQPIFSTLLAGSSAIVLESGGRL